MKATEDCPPWFGSCRAQGLLQLPLLQRRQLEHYLQRAESLEKSFCPKNPHRFLAFASARRNLHLLKGTSLNLGQNPICAGNIFPALQLPSAYPVLVSQPRRRLPWAEPRGAGCALRTSPTGAVRGLRPSLVLGALPPVVRADKTLQIRKHVLKSEESMQQTPRKLFSSLSGVIEI